MGPGNMMGGGGGSNPKLNAKNRGAFAVGGMGRPGNGGGAGTIPGLNINRDRWKGFNADQRQDWRAFQQAGGKAGTGGGFGAFQRQQMPQMSQTPPGALPSQPAQNTTPPDVGPAVDPAGNVAKQVQASAGLSELLAAHPQLASQFGGVLGSLAGLGGGGQPSQGTTPPAAPPPATSPPAQGGFARPRRNDAPGIGGKDARWWQTVGYTPRFVSQLPGLLQQAGDA